MKPEEEEILKILRICFESQEQILNTCINKLKKYDPETLKTVTPIINKPDNTLYNHLTEIINYEENTTEENFYSTLNKKNFMLRYLYIDLYFKKKHENKLLDIYTNEFIKDMNLNITPQEEEEIKKELEKQLQRITKQLEETYKD